MTPADRLLILSKRMTLRLNEMESEEMREIISEVRAMQECLDIKPRSMKLLEPLPPEGDYPEEPVTSVRKPIRPLSKSPWRTNMFPRRVKR